MLRVSRLRIIDRSRLIWGAIPVIDGLREGENDQNGTRSDQSYCNPVYITPVVLDGNKAGDNDSASDACGQSCGIYAVYDILASI